MRLYTKNCVIVKFCIIVVELPLKYQKWVAKLAVFTVVIIKWLIQKCSHSLKTLNGLFFFYLFISYLDFELVFFYMHWQVTSLKIKFDLSLLLMLFKTPNICCIIIFIFGICCIAFYVLIIYPNEVLLSTFLHLKYVLSAQLLIWGITCLNKWNRCIF